MDAWERILVEPVVTYNRGDDWARAAMPDVDYRDTPLKDISRQAVWTLSSCKRDGFGINELLDDSPDKMWQSDGLLPHTATIEFQKKTDVCFLFMYLDFKNDETYTPGSIMISKGSAVFSMKDHLERDVHEPNGWLCFDLRTMDHRGEMKPSRVFAIQVVIVENHQNGRDTHIRHMRVIGPHQRRVNTEYLTTAELEVNVLADVDDLNHQALYKDYIIR